MNFAFEIFWQQPIGKLVIDLLTLTQEVKFNNITMVWYLDPAEESVISSLIHTNPILTLKFRNMAWSFLFFVSCALKRTEGIGGENSHTQAGLSPPIY